MKILKNIALCLITVAFVLRLRAILLIGTAGGDKNPEGKYVRNYVGEQYYIRTDQRGLTQMKVFQQELFDRGKYFYLTDEFQSIGLSEEEFYKLIGQQKNLDPKKK